MLPMLAASVLTDDPVTVTDCPDITDVADMAGVLSALGCKVGREGRNITVCGGCCSSEIPPALAKAIRSSVFMLGPLLARTGEVRMHAPGGCRIGARPLDIHLGGLASMGAGGSFDDDFVVCRAGKLRGADIVVR